MAKRTDLHELLSEIVNMPEPDGDTHVYYNSTENIRMKFPAIKYSRKKINNTYADDLVYKQKRAYTVIVIDYAADSPIVDSVSNLPECTHERFYKANNLNHDVFTIYW